MLTSEAILSPQQFEAFTKEAVIYQIYPASFCSANGGDKGDLAGITSKLDYLKDLTDYVWLSPIYKSPNVDMGYDISDYRSIDPIYGTMEDFDTMLKAIHSKGMKLIMDLVVNHTSDLHPWFIESKSSLSNLKRDWYIWRKGKIIDGVRHPPNNWLSVFRGGSAWEYDATTDEYYLHLFVTEQPDLNWENAELRAAIYDMMHFWLGEKGVDGFRMDVINLIAKAPGLPDVPAIEFDSDGVALEFQPSFAHTANQPVAHVYLKEMNEQVLRHYQVLTVGETPFGFDDKVLIPYILPSANELQQIFHFELSKLDEKRNKTRFAERKWKLTELKRIVGKWQHAMFEAGTWNAIYLENHDQARSISRLANDAPEFRVVSGKLLAMLQISLSGTMYIYQGQELGSINIPKDWGIEEYLDVATITQYDISLKERQKETGEEKPDMTRTMESIRTKARDNSRLPHQWNAVDNAGFTAPGVKPWMRVNDDYRTFNASVQMADSDSVLNFWKQALKVRKEHLVLVYGSYEVVDETNEAVYAFIRKDKSSSTVTILNFTPDVQTFTPPSSLKLGKILLGNYDHINDDAIELKAYEGRLYELI